MSKIHIKLNGGIMCGIDHRRWHSAFLHAVTCAKDTRATCLLCLRKSAKVAWNGRMGEPAAGREQKAEVAA